MIERGKFGPEEAISLLTITIATKALSSSLSTVIQLVGPAGWYMTLISAGVSILFFSFIYLLLKMFPKKNLMEIFDEVLGKCLGRSFSFVIAASLLLIAALNLREFTDMLKIYVMPLSPPIYIMVLFLLGILTFSFLGLESLARFSRLASYSLLFGFIMVIVMSFENFRLHRLFPILGHGLFKTVYYGVMRSSAYMEVLLVGVFASSFQGIKYVKKIGFISLILSGVIISSAILACDLVFPYFTGREIVAPMYTMVSIINLGWFFQRLDPLFIFIWNISSLISVTAKFYGSLMIFCHIFNIDDKKPVIIPFGILLLTLATIPRDIITVIKVYMPFVMQWGGTVFYLLPCMILIIAILRKKKVKLRGA